MDHAHFDRLKAQVAVASARQILELEGVIQDVISVQVAEIALARRTIQACGSRICPHCQSNDIMLHGKDENGRQRFKCRNCGRTYNILTGTPMARARMPEKWGQYLGCMTEHMPLRKIVASGIGVHLVTAWRWRHRFLTAAANDNTAVLSGVVEADTTFFRRSFKGSRGVNIDTPRESRAVRTQGWDVEASGLPPRHVPVLMALDSGGGVFEAILPSLTELQAALEGRIAAGSVLCSNGSSVYFNIAERAHAQHCAVFVPVPAQEAVPIHSEFAQMWTPGCLGLGRVHSHQRRLKYMINERCRGVATKYLMHYLGWNRAMIRPGYQGKMLLDRALQ